MYSHQTESIASSLNKIMHLCVTLMQSPCQILHIFFVVVYASLCEECTSSEIASIIWNLIESGIGSGEPRELLD
jgi:hypothetical protein